MKKSQLPLKLTADSSKKPPEKEVLEELLKRHFGHYHFRFKQLEAIQAVISGKDCFCLMPTGGGKSLCYQIPALEKAGIVLVVSPLIALMENQVTMLKQKGIPAEFLSSTQVPAVRVKIQEELNCEKPSLRLLYVTPELVVTPGFNAKLCKLHCRGLLSLIAVDEAHCISSWGHDFRPAYRKLSSLKKEFPNVPLLALTATASPRVEKDVIESLGLKDPFILRASFNRPNIYYEVRYKDITDDINTDLSNLIKSKGSHCSIIYCLERSTCDELSDHLRKNGISCAAYHAGLSNKTRSNVLDGWVSSRIKVVVATVAFGNTLDIENLKVYQEEVKTNLYNFGQLSGNSEWTLVCIHLPKSLGYICRMGIDRRDVRLVCHYNIPKSMESFYQESGRAGRDNLPSESILYYGLDDRRRMEFILSNAGSRRQESSSVSEASVETSLADFAKMVEYCGRSGCRRKCILESFGEKASTSLCQKTCDVCKHPSKVDAALAKLDHFSLRRISCGPGSGFIKSDQESEFWDRDGDKDLSQDSISASDGSDEADEVNLCTKPNSRRIEQLEAAEERFYASNNIPKKKAATPVLISAMLREAAKHRLSSALKQAQARFGIPMGELDLLAAILEKECYEKFKNTGKNFYNSQVVSTARRLSSSSYEQIEARFCSLSSQSATTTTDHLLPCMPSSSSTSLLSGLQGTGYDDQSNPEKRAKR